MDNNGSGTRVEEVAKRPTGLVIVMIVIGLQALLGLLSISAFGDLIGLVVSVAGVLLFVGLAKRRTWAWGGTFAWFGLNMLMSFFSGSELTFASVAVFAAVAAYMSRPEIRSFLDVPSQPYSSSRSSGEVLAVLRQMESGEIYSRYWDDFLSVPLDDPALDRVRERCDEIWYGTLDDGLLTFDGKDYRLTARGRAEIRRLMRLVESSGQALDRGPEQASV